MTPQDDKNKEPNEAEDHLTSTDIDMEEGSIKNNCEDELEEEEYDDALEFQLAVDPSQNYKATEIKLLARPHMRAFHCSWWSFFMAFFIWFAIAPLLPEVQESLGLTDQDIWITNIVSVVGDIFFRFIFGPLCDLYGARILMALLLMGASIPTACTGLVNSLAGLIVLRLFISFAGATFVMCQYWATDMFANEIVGTANALVGGWGNLGGGVTQIVMGSLLFPLFRDVFFDGDADMAWRTVCIVPAVCAFLTGALVLCVSEDCPRGNYSQLKKQGMLKTTSPADSFWRGASNWNTWLLSLHYGCCFGVELTMYNEAATFFHDKFGLSTEKAAAIASIFGFMNLFSRGLGGYLSDKIYSRPTSMGNMRGRILIQTITLAVEGVLIFIFPFTDALWLAIVVMTLFAIFAQAAEGSTYAIVAYVEPTAIGSVSGIVGAGGPTGAVLFGFGFMFLKKTTHGFLLMGGCVLFSALTCFAFTLPQQQHDSCIKEDDQASSDVQEQPPQIYAAEAQKVDKVEAANDHSKAPIAQNLSSPEVFNF